MLPAPKKALGQHFLTDPDLLDRFTRPLEEMGLKAGGAVVEIGPGRGDLTAALRRRGFRVVALELDRELVPVLREKFKDDAGVEIRHADALRYDYGALPKPLWLAGNLPYQIATPLLVHLLRSAREIAGAVFLLQKEMATRLLGQPNSKDYAAVTALLQSYWDLKKLFHIGRGRFTPPPRVDSTLITVRPKRPPRVPFERFDDLEALLRRAFAERRKTLTNNFRTQPEKLAALAAAGIDPGRRAESLSLEEFARWLEKCQETGQAEG
jgi:16S rRNA (adenine1518-N6/adenine1519-N6)-dimethyltransferase